MQLLRFHLKSLDPAQRNGSRILTWDSPANSAMPMCSWWSWKTKDQASKKIVLAVSEGRHFDRGRCEAVWVCFLSVWCKENLNSNRFRWKTSAFCAFYGLLNGDWDRDWENLRLWQWSDRSLHLQNFCEEYSEGFRQKRAAFAFRERAKHRSLFVMEGNSRSAVKNHFSMPAGPARALSQVLKCRENVLPKSRNHRFGSTSWTAKIWNNFIAILRGIGTLYFRNDNDDD
jgi:hypothetical protein